MEIDVKIDMGIDVEIDVGNLDVETRGLGGLDSQPPPGQSPRFL